MNNIKINELSDAIRDIIEDYYDEVDEGAEELIVRTADECKNEIQSYCQSKGWKDYSKGWNVKQELRGKGSECIIHNRKHYRLIHLLENGHDIVHEGRVVGVASAFPHVKPAEERAVRKIEKGIKKVIQK